MIINLKSENELSGFYIVYEGSTNLENKGNFGISHLMEHLFCKNFDHLLDDFDRDGISWNAYTDTNLINFYLVHHSFYILYKNIRNNAGINF